MDCLLSTGAADGVAPSFLASAAFLGASAGVSISAIGAGDLEKAHRELEEASFADREDSREDKFRPGLRPREVAPLSGCRDMAKRWIHGSGTEARNRGESNRKSCRVIGRLQRTPATAGTWGDGSLKINRCFAGGGKGASRSSRRQSLRKATRTYGKGGVSCRLN